MNIKGWNVTWDSDYSVWIITSLANINIGIAFNKNEIDKLIDKFERES